MNRQWTVGTLMVLCGAALGASPAPAAVGPGQGILPVAPQPQRSNPVSHLPERVPGLPAFALSVRPEGWILPQKYLAQYLATVSVRETNARSIVEGKDLVLFVEYTAHWYGPQPPEGWKQLSQTYLFAVSEGHNNVWRFSSVMVGETRLRDAAESIESSALSQAVTDAFGAPRHVALELKYRGNTAATMLCTLQLTSLTCKGPDHVMPPPPTDKGGTVRDHRH